MNISRFSGFILILFFPIFVFSQQYGFRNFSIEEGMPQSEVQALIQDRQGYLWAGTNGGGLVRFNGKSFEVFTTRDGLPDNIVYSLCEDLDGNIWIGSLNCISKYDGNSFKVFQEEDSSGFIRYTQIFADKNNRIWATSQDDQILFRLVEVSGDRIQPISDLNNEISNNIQNIFYTWEGTHFINTREGLFELKDRNKLVKSILNEYEELQDRIIVPRFQELNGGLIISSIDPVTAEQFFHHFQNGILTNLEIPENPWFDAVNIVFKDSQGRTWFANFGNGVAMYDPALKKYKFFRQENGLKSDFIAVIIEDHEGNIWMGSRGSGMIKYSSNSFVSFNFDNYIDDNVVRDIFQDSQGNLWFGLAATGLVKYDGSDFTAYPKRLFPGIHNVRGMTELSPGLFLLASINGLFKFDGKSIQEVSASYGLTPNLAYMDLKRYGDTIWLTSLNVGIARIINGSAEIFNMQSRHIRSNILYAAFKDSRGDIWFCSNNGVGRYTNGQFDWFTVEDGLSYPITLQATEDYLGRIWIATYMEGINIFDGKNFTRIGKTDGLISDNIYSIITDSQGQIWAGTARGVSRIQLDQKGEIASINNYGVYDGFSGIENNGTAIFMDKNENLWFGTVRGAMRYDPKEYKPNLNPPEIHITKVGLFFKDVDWRQDNYSIFHTGSIPFSGLPAELVLPHDSNHLSFEFEALSYQVPEKVRYQWKLDGLDKGWSPVSDKTEAVYANMPPGEYTFMVRGMNNDGIWNESPANFDFVIKAAWRDTWYFFVLLSILILSGITLTFLLRIRIIESKRKELEVIVEEKTREVRNQKEEITLQAEHLQTSYNNLENLSEIGKIITSQLSVEKIIDTVYESINKLMDATVFGIGILNKETNALDFPGVKEKGETLDFLSFSLDDDVRLSTYCIKTGKEVFINNFDKEYIQYITSITPPTNNSGNSSSILYLPLIVNKEPIGVITVQSFNKNAYTEYHLNILRNLAVYTKIALENASAYREIELQSDHLKQANKDISNQKLKIEETNKELVDLNKEKNHLIGIVAHDLRNPLTSSLTIAEKLKSDNISHKTGDEESLNFLVNALKRMNEMVSKILDIRMIEQKMINLKHENTNIGEIVQDVSRNFHEIAMHKNITINLENAEVFGMVDRNYLTQVFENLLSNAIKFSPLNSDVWIRVKEEDGEIRINFIDEGPGIKAEEMDKLFGKFQKLSARPTAGEGSTGLGLSIVKKYVEVMGGRVWCESYPGKGSNFIVAFAKSDLS